MPQNVKEQIILTDTILVSKFVGQMTDRPQGWFGSFADAGAAGEFSFLNVRNRSIGVAYNNQDARDQLPFGMRITSIGVKFFGPAAASQFTACLNKGSTTLDRVPVGDDVYVDPLPGDLTNREELHTAVWEADLPNHVSLILRTNQDIRLRGPAAIFTPGFGAVGGGWGWGSPGDLNFAQSGTVAPAISHEPGGPSYGMFSTNLETIQHGEADLRRRFPFPIPIDVPKRANLSITLKLSQYGKEMLKAMTGPYWYPMANMFTAQGLTKTVKAAMFGVDVTIKGERLVQQRGDYHV
jgi:hypothetical protein